MNKKVYMTIFSAKTVSKCPNDLKVPILLRNVVDTCLDIQLLEVSS